MNKDYFIQKIGWYRHLFTLFSTITIACIAWLVTNYDKTVTQLIFIDVITVIAAIFSVIVVAGKVRKYLKLLRTN